MAAESSEYIRRKYKLRRMILSQKIILPRDAALPFVGPDCAYHLYNQMRWQTENRMNASCSKIKHHI